jgi:hypothetical protein
VVQLRPGCEADLENLIQTRAIIARWVEHYNEERLHAGLGYLPPAEFYRGNPSLRIEERQITLDKARQKRRRINNQRVNRAA